MTTEDELVEDMAKVLAFLDEHRSRGLSASLRGPQAAVLVSGYDSVFVKEAERSAVRAEQARGDGVPILEAGAAAAAILCASASCEAAVSEYLAKLEFAGTRTPAEILAIRNHPDAATQWKMLLKLLAPNFALGSSREFLALGCLVELRNLVAHRNARTSPVGTFPLSLSNCVRQRVVPVRPAANADWTSVIFVAEVAAWAATTARAWLDLVGKLLPEPGLT